MVTKKISIKQFFLKIYINIIDGFDFIIFSWFLFLNINGIPFCYKIFLYFIFTDIYSSHTSSSFSPSPSDGGGVGGGTATPNSLILDRENNRLNDKTHAASVVVEENGNLERLAKKSKVSNELSGKVGSSGVGVDNKTIATTGDGKNGAQVNGEGTYHCQFCDKSFPRLGYLKKHEQVNIMENRFYFIIYFMQAYFL